MMAMEGVMKDVGGQVRAKLHGVLPEGDCRSTTLNWRPTGIQTRPLSNSSLLPCLEPGELA